MHLLYQVTRHLDLYSQRNLFLCSTQLYNKWHLHIATDNTVWRYIQSCIDIIAANISSGICSSASLCLTLKELSGREQNRRFDAALKFCPSGRPSTMMIACWPPSLQLQGIGRLYPDLQWTEMTKDQFWHRLAALPARVAHALFEIASANKAGCDDLKAQGQQLCTSKRNDKKRKHDAV